MEVISAKDLRALKSSAEGRKRITDRLKEAVVTLASVICENTIPNDKIELENGAELQVVYLYSERVHAGYKYLQLHHPDINEYGTMVDTPLTSGYLFGDFNVPYEGIAREGLIFIAENAKEIISKFAELNEQKIKSAEVAENKLSEIMKVIEDMKET